MENISYRSVPGEHCGSTAMRNLLAHYVGLELSEAMVFGLGSGIDFLRIESDQVTPSVFCTGRSVTLEQDVASALGVAYREQIEPDDARAFALVRDEVLAGRPTMLSGDAYYLDYRDFKVHFPAHRFVLVGIDDTEQVGPTLARYTAACIEKYGTGGGMFRKLFAEFAREAHALVPHRAPTELAELAAASAARWSLLAAQLDRFAADGVLLALEQAAESASAITELERRLFESAERASTTSSVTCA